MRGATTSGPSEAGQPGPSLAQSPSSRSRTIALLTPTARDGAVAERVLRNAGLAAVACADMASLCAMIATEVGTVVVGEEALGHTSSGTLLATLEAQPPWSDVPVVVLTGEGELSRSIPRALEAVAARASVTLLERPVRVATLVTVLRSALDARQRQYDVRDHLEERKRLLANERAARHEAERAAALAEEANRAKSEFLTVMSHELRTPLNAIGGYAELIELGVHGPINDAQREDLARIRKSERHLLGLINGVLNYSRIEAGAVRYDMEDVSADEVLLTCEALVAPQARRKGLVLSYAGSDPALMVRCDREKFQQIVLNLLTNAVKFTDRGGRVELECAAAGTAVRIRVSDTGCGIDGSQLARVFEPFVQVDAALTRTKEGVGLGLAISRDLARGMGGDITAESTPQVGSVFILTLPRARR